VVENSSYRSPLSGLLGKKTKMKFQAVPLTGAYVIELEPHEDHRGFFARAFCQAEFEKQGLPTEIKQSNLSCNHCKGTLRGLHYQVKPHCEAKLIRVIKGAVFDVIVDLRSDSSTYCQWFGIELKASEYKAVFVPEGMAHGFLTLADETLIFYEMFESYHPECARGVRYNDPAFGIRWPAEIKIISEKDQRWPDFGQ
jgi:dTDP-4-dehydrorhamnose 3,5-epimerase